MAAPINGSALADLDLTSQIFPELPPAVGARLLRDLQQIPTTSSICVALSGGLDSLLLLHSVARYRRLIPRVTIRAIHVHHGLSPHADAWADHCRAECARLGIELSLVSVQVGEVQGLGLEAAARQVRYQAFNEQLAEGDVLLLAHHQNDQAETLLLNLMRGSGVRGLAGMPRQRRLGQGLLFRPLLDWTRSELEEIARAWRLTWVEDESNQDEALARNYLRHQVIPALERQWPATVSRIARSADWCREADELLEELAAEDLRRALDDAQSLCLHRLADLSAARQRHLLRYWLQSSGFGFPGEAGFQRIFTEMLPARVDAEPELRWPGAILRRYRDRLVLLPELPQATPDLVLPWDLRQPLQLPQGLLSLQALAAGEVNGFGLRQPRPDEVVTVRFRQGGEVMRPAPSGMRRPLKKLLQEWGVPPWQRNSLPLVYFGDTLAAVPGYAVAREYLESGAAALVIAWQPVGDKRPGSMGQFD